MPALLLYIVNAVTGAIAWVIARTGIRLAIAASTVALWLVLIVTFTTAVNTCFGSSSCGFQTDWSRLSPYLKFGMSLVPSNVSTVITCIISAKFAGWTAIALGRVLRTKASVAGVELK